MTNSNDDMAFDEDVDMAFDKDWPTKIKWGMRPGLRLRSVDLCGLLRPPALAVDP